MEEKLILLIEKMFGEDPNQPVGKLVLELRKDPEYVKRLTKLIFKYED